MSSPSFTSALLGLGLVLGAQLFSAETAAQDRGANGGPVQAQPTTAPSAPESASPTSVSAEVIVVHASNAAGTVDPTLAQIPALRRPPFDSFRSMRVLSRPRMMLAVGRASDVSLPNGRRLQLLWSGRGADGRHRVRVSINRPNQADYLPLLQVASAPGDPFFVAGQTYQGGTLVIGVRVGERAPAQIQGGPSPVPSKPSAAAGSPSKK